MATGFEDRPRLKTGWGWVLASGILFILVGLVAAVQPLATGLAAGIVLAVGLMIGGGFALAAGIANLGHRGSWLYVVLGLLGLLLGLWTFFFPFAGALSLVWAMGAWLLAGGILLLVAAFQAERRRGGLLLLGGIDVLLGLLLIFLNPGAALLFLAVVVGVSFVMRGIGTVMFALHLRQLSRI